MVFPQLFLPDLANRRIGGTWNQAVGLTFAADGRLFVWEKVGKVWIVENGVKLAQPLIDISDEVGNWGDFGLVGFALDPNFLSNGYIYLSYVVDHHHLINYGTPNYNPNSNEYSRIIKAPRPQRHFLSPLIIPLLPSRLRVRSMVGFIRSPAQPRLI